MKWTISRKLGLVVGFAVLGFVLAGVVTYRTVASRQKTAARLLDSCQIRDGLDRLSSQLGALETSRRSHSALGRQRSALGQTLAELHAAAQGDAAQAARVANLQTLVHGATAGVRLPSEQMERALADIRRHEANLLIGLDREIETESEDSVQLVLGIAVAILGTLLLGFGVGGAITESVRRLSGSVRQIAARTGCPVPMQAKDEIAELADIIASVDEKMQEAEDLARRDRGCLEALLKTIGDGAIISEPGKPPALFNAAARAILGAGPDGAALNGWPNLYGFYTPDTRTPFVGDLPHDVALRGEIPEDIELYVTPPGSAEGRWLRLSARPLPDGAALSVLRDTTEQKRAEKALRENEEKFRSFAEATNEWIWSADSNGNFVYSNPAASAILGCNPSELPGQPIESFVHEEDRERFGRLLRECLAWKRCWVGLTLRWKHSSGSSRYTESNAVPITGPNGQAVGMRGADRDVTERRATEIQIQHLNHQLERRVEQLNAANKELEAFSYSVSHDLRAPLRSIDGFSQALLEDYGDRLDAEGQGYLQRVRAASQRMAQLIDDLMQLSRVARNELSLQPVDLAALAQSVGAEMAARQPNRAVEFVVAQGLKVTADPHLLRIVMENLLDNAWKFTRNNPHARVEVGMEDYKGDRACFVRDNGVGFDMAYSGKLFGAFQRLHAMTEFEGTGIGLATVQRIVNRHGGQIAAQAVVGEGATFYFTLS